MALQQSLRVIVVVVDHSGVADCVEQFFSGVVREVVHSVVDFVIQAQGPLQL